MAAGITFVLARGRTDVAFSSVSSEVNLSGSQADPRSLGARATPHLRGTPVSSQPVGQKQHPQMRAVLRARRLPTDSCPVGVSCQGRRNSTKTVVHEAVSDLLTTVERPDRPKPALNKQNRVFLGRFSA